MHEMSEKDGDAYRHSLLFKWEVFLFLIFFSPREFKIPVSRTPSPSPLPPHRGTTPLRPHGGTTPLPLSPFLHTVGPTEKCLNLNKGKMINELIIDAR